MRDVGRISAHKPFVRSVVNLLATYNGKRKHVGHRPGFRRIGLCVVRGSVGVGIETVINGGPLFEADASFHGEDCFYGQSEVMNVLETVVSEVGIVVVFEG